MIILAALLIGAYVGWRRAVALKGNRKDQLQYAASHALAFAAIGLIATVLIDRLL
ncbi:hypothetical protein [Paracoccus sp. M683]|uniref:hypothetical protein n=1 Tax=Paracoccus sp. M683 TaxID=2594268 RepID=UPI00163DE32E|nr:hypothetical protein [Paracoccus sp. M683]